MVTIEYQLRFTQYTNIKVLTIRQIQKKTEYNIYFSKSTFEKGLFLYKNDDKRKNQYYIQR